MIEISYYKVFLCVCVCKTFCAECPPCAIAKTLVLSLKLNLLGIC